MFRIGLLKRGCLAFVMLFGLVFSYGIDEVDATFLIDKSGCNIINVNTQGVPQEVGYTNAAQCGSFSPSAQFDFNGAQIINDDSSVVGGMKPYLAAPVSYEIVVVNPDFSLAPNFTVVPPAGCKDFFGQTNDNPILNQGVIDFDNVAPAGDYRTCLTMDLTNAPAGELHYEIDGWAWNTNLGWISTFSEDDFNLSAGGNRGLDSGNYDHKSMVKIESPSGASYKGLGELYGFWWNDAAGWIKLNCAADNTLNASDVSQCAVNGGADYQVYIDSFDAGTGRAVLAGYAWSDSVGYIDFTGVQVAVPGLSSTYEAKVSYVRDGNGGGNIYANGDRGYGIEVSFFDGATNVTDEFANESMQNGFCLVYSDGRKLDTIDNINVTSSTSGGVPNYSCGDSATQFAEENNVNMNQLGWDAVAGGDLMNNQSNRFEYNSTKNVFELIGTETIKSLIPTEGDNLQLSQVAMYNDITKIEKSDLDPSLNGALRFLNPYDLKIVGSQNVTEATCVDSDVELEFDSPIQASMCGDFYAGGEISNLSGSIVGEPNVNALYGDKFDSITATQDQAGSIDFLDATISQNGFGSADMWITLNLAQGVTAAELNPLKSLMNLSVASEVSYRLPSDSLVRRLGPEVQNESQNIFELNIQGGLADRSFGSSTFSSGSKDTQGVNKGLEVKERVYRVLRNIIQMDPKPGNCGNLPFAKIDRRELVEVLASCGRVSQSGGRDVAFIGAQDLKGADGSYVKYSELKGLIGNQTSKEGASPVVVMYGLDFVIDENIVPGSINNNLQKGGDASELSDELLNGVSGFVVIESESKEGGEVIVSSEVTDIVGYIYADGRMLTAPDVRAAEEAASGDVEVSLNRGVIGEELLFNQFSLLGALYSSNCIGCASNVPALRSDGSVAASRQLSLIEDLNAFRYTPLNFNIGSYNIEVPELDGFGIPTGETTTENYTCLVPCNTSSSSFNPLDGQGRSKNECRYVESKITAENACFDDERYTSGESKLSLIEESIAGSVVGGKSGINQLDLILDENPNNPNYSQIRSVNIRSLEIPEGMPVFSVISR